MLFYFFTRFFYLLDFFYTLLIVLINFLNVHTKILTHFNLNIQSLNHMGTMQGSASLMDIKVIRVNAVSSTSQSIDEKIDKIYT